MLVYDLKQRSSNVKKDRTEFAPNLAKMHYLKVHYHHKISCPKMHYY